MPHSGKRLIKFVRDFLKLARKDPRLLSDEQREAFLEKLERADTLAANSLSLPEGVEIFGLTRDPRSTNIWREEKEDLIPVPSSLIERLEEIAAVIGKDPVASD
ncbi:hypothetical protein V8E54_007714 [Elaphomyces granulatus]